MRCADPAYAEIEALVVAEGRVAGSARRTLARIVRGVVSRVFDPDGAGAPFRFDGEHQCPRCRALLTRGGTETKVPWLVDPVAATHARWDALTDAEKAAEVRAAGCLLS